MLYLAFCFYGNVADHLFIKLLFSVFLLMTMYWVDIYRFSRIFITYIKALRNFHHNNMERSYPLFEKLVQMEFAPSLPYVALMKFRGLGTTVNVDAAKYFCERAIRNDYTECLYLLSVIDFFGDNLTDYFGGQRCTSKLSNDELHHVGIKTHTEVVDPDYRECVFHLQEYFNNNKIKEKNYAEACALMGYCLITGKGCEKDNDKGTKYLELAEKMQSKNVRYFKDCLENNTEIYKYTI